MYDLIPISNRYCSYKSFPNYFKHLLNIFFDLSGLQKSIAFGFVTLCEFNLCETLQSMAMFIGLHLIRLELGPTLLVKR